MNLNLILLMAFWYLSLRSCVVHKSIIIALNFRWQMNEFCPLNKIKTRIKNYIGALESSTKYQCSFELGRLLAAMTSQGTNVTENGTSRALLSYDTTNVIIAMMLAHFLEYFFAFNGPKASQ